MGTFEEFGRKTDEFVGKAQKKTMELYKDVLKHVSVLAQKASVGARDAASKIEGKLRVSAEGSDDAVKTDHAFGARSDDAVKTDRTFESRETNGKVNLRK